LRRKIIETYEVSDIPCFRNYKQDAPCCNIEYKLSQDMGHFNDRNKVCPENKPICKNYDPLRKEPWGTCVGQEYTKLIDNNQNTSEYEYSVVQGKGCSGNKLINGDADFFGDSDQSYNTLVGKCKSTCNLSSYCGGFSIKNHGFPKPGRKCELKTFDVKNCSKGDEEKSKSWIKEKKYIIYDFIPINLKKKKIYECKDPQYPYIHEDGYRCSKLPDNKEYKENKPFDNVIISKRYSTIINNYTPLKKMEEFAQFLDNKTVAIAINYRTYKNLGRDTGNGIQFDRDRVGHQEKYRIIYTGEKNYIYIVGGNKNKKCRYQQSNNKIVCDGKDPEWSVFSINTEPSWNINGKRFEIYLTNIKESETIGKNGICGFKSNDNRIECNREFKNIYEKFIFIIL